MPTPSIPITVHCSGRRTILLVMGHQVPFKRLTMTSTDGKAMNLAVEFDMAGMTIDADIPIPEKETNATDQSSPEEEPKP